MRTRISPNCRTFQSAQPHSPGFRSLGTEAQSVVQNGMSDIFIGSLSRYDGTARDGSESVRSRKSLFIVILRGWGTEEARGPADPPCRSADPPFSPLSQRHMLRMKLSIPPCTLK